MLIILVSSGCASVPTTSPLVSNEERRAYEKSMNEKKQEYYYDKVMELSRVGYLLLEKLPPEYRKNEKKKLPLILLETKLYSDHFFAGDSRSHFLTVLGVIPEWMPAASQVQRGDVLVAVNGCPIQGGKDWKKAQLELQNSEQVEVTFLRDTRRWDETFSLRKVGVDLAFLVDPQMGCINAYLHPDGYIAVTTPMLRFLENDDELAYLLGHEIAHAVKGHLEENMGGRYLGVLVGNMAASFFEKSVAGTGQSAGIVSAAAVSAPFSRAIEEEADEIGFQIMRDAGYKPEGALTLMKRMAMESPEGSEASFFKTHPVSADRISHLEQILQTDSKGIPQ